MAALLALAGVLLSILLNFHVHSSQADGSDFKTMYGSAAAFAHGSSAYAIPGIASVFDRNAIVQPASWYGHSPVYPPFTIALLTPVAALPMDLAIYAWVVFSGAVFALALASLTHFAGDRFGLTRPWRLLLIALAAASPLLSFALQMGNVSVVTSALCLLALVLPHQKLRTPRTNDWPRALALALALLLKPHLAIWVALAMLFLYARRCRHVAARAFGAAAAIAALFAARMALLGDLTLQVGGYLATLRAEVAGGSMNATQHDLVAVAAHITSLDSLTGYWTHNFHLLTVTLLILAFVALVAASLRLRNAEASLQLLLVGAWSSFGLLATYHRAHDGIILLVLLPVLLSTLRHSWRTLQPWLIFALALAMSIGPTWETWQWLAARPVIGPVAQLLLYRQAPVATLLLACLLVATVVHEAFAHTVPQRETGAALRSLPA